MLLTTIIILFLILDLWMFIEDRYILSSFAFLAQIVGFWYFVPAVHDYVASQGLVTMLTTQLGTYLAVGVGVAVLKWVMHIAKSSAKVKAQREEFLRTYKEPTEQDFVRIYESTRITLKTPAAHRRYKFLEGIYGMSAGTNLTRLDFEDPNVVVNTLAPQAKNNIDRISSWIFQWPVVAIATALEDILIKLGRNVARLLDYLFTRLSRLSMSKATEGI